MSRIGSQHGMSGVENEELKRRKSEILLPSPSFSGASAAAAGYNYSYSQSHSHGQGIGLGMSPFTASTAHPQSLAQVESLTPQELELLNEHRRSAQLRMSSSSGSSSNSATLMDRSGSIGSSLGYVQHLSAQEQDRLLEHRKSTPDLMYDSRLRRLSKESVDMIVQPLPSRDARSGMQWFSQVNSTPSTASPRPSLTPRDTHLVHAAAEEAMGTTSRRVSDSTAGSNSPTMLPPILGNYDDSRQDPQVRLRTHSSHIHPLSRPSLQNDFPSPDRRLSHEEPRDRFQFNPMLSPRMERYLEEQYYPIRKREVLDAIERMETNEFLGLKALVTESYANEQFRNPECLVNMVAVLCAVKSPDSPSSRDIVMDYDSATSGGADSNRVHGDQEAMDVDFTGVPAVIEKRLRFVLDIDIDSFRRDPEPDVYGLGSLTVKSQGPATSFVAGFEPVIENELEDPPRSVRGYPSNARIGRFYLPESSYWTPESLDTQLDPNGPWVCCRFEEYQGVWVWVLESVLDKYHEIAQRHKMALTLAGTHLRHHVPQSAEEWRVSDERAVQYEMRMEESVLYPEMMRQVWRDMHQHYQQQQQHPPYYQHQKMYPQQYQHRHSQQYSSPPPPQPQSLPRHSLRPSQPLPPLNNRVATFEEYQKGLFPADHRRDSFSKQHPPPHPPLSSTSFSSSAASAHGTYYNDYRQHQQNLHREDLSSAPSSPRSPQRDDFQEDNQVNESDITTVNLHRRISIAELCNPMQSLATERDRFRDDTRSLSMLNTTTATTTNSTASKRSSM
ncbi:hypothetical protein BGZ51_008885 [Haplosporangium sp. Z 767]|nr:hypothetical protein BGZ51_008885 [Haplosporangium sp. Z 767]